MKALQILTKACLLLLLGIAPAVAQTTLYSEDFEATHQWTLNVSTGTNGADNNFFTVSDNESGNDAGQCGSASGGDKSLHVTSVFNPSGGASYDVGGLCSILFCPQTNMRAESPTFSTIGQTAATLKFNYIENGDGTNDNATLMYNTGSGWILLEDLSKTLICGSGQGQWTAYSIALPAAALDEANVQIGINWTNNDDGIGTAPSFAMDDITIETPAPTSTACSDLFFSEYIEGSGSNKALEIYNPTSAAINLANYKVELYNNGASSPNSTFTLSGSLAANDVFIIVNSSAAAAFKANADAENPVTNFNGDDAIALVNISKSTTLDIIGVIGQDGEAPGNSEWSVGSDGTANHTLVRMKTVQQGTTDWSVGATQWLTFAQNTADSLGSHTSECAGGGTITPPPTPSATSKLVMTEIMYNPPEDGTDTLEFIEFYNNDTQPINLDGYTFADGVTFTFPAYTVPVGGFVIIAIDTMAMKSVLGSPANSRYFEWVSSGLSNSGEIIVLKDGSNNTVDSVNYDDAIFTAEADGGGYSLTLCDPNDDNADADTPGSSNWSVRGAATGQIINGSEIFASPGSLTCEALPTASLPVYDIATLTTENALLGAADSLGVNAIIYGTVYGVNLRSSGLTFTVRDATGGINVFSFSNVSNYMVMEGDSVKIGGTIGQFRGLTQISPDSIIVVATGRTLKMPTVVTALNESTESDLIKIEDVQLVTPSQWQVTGGSFNVDITDGTNTYTLRVDENTSLYGEPAPSGQFDVTGIGSQYDTDGSAPFSDGYQIIPRRKSDIDGTFTTPPTGVMGDLIITEIMYNNPGNDDFEFIEIYNNEGSAVDVTSFSFSQGFDFTFPAFSFPAGSFIIVSKADTATFINQFGMTANTKYFQWTTSGGLSNGGEDVILVNNIGQTIDSVDYDDNNPLTAADGNGGSLVLCDITLDNADAGTSATNWSVSVVPTMDINGSPAFATPGSLSCTAASPVTIWNGMIWDNGVPTMNSKAIIAGNYSGMGFATDSLVVNNGIMFMPTSDVDVKGGVMNMGGTVGGSGFVTFSGASAQMIEGTFTNIKINNAAGVMASGPVMVMNTLKMEAGTFTTNNNLTLASTFCFAVCLLRFSNVQQRHFR